MKTYSKAAKERINSGLCPCGNRPPEDYVTCDKCRGRGRQKFLEMREAIFNHYGHACECCGENRSPFLAIDHIGGKNREGDQRQLSFWIVVNSFPAGFRILCHNCNFAVRWGRECPHQTTVLKETKKTEQ